MIPLEAKMSHCRMALPSTNLVSWGNERGAGGDLWPSASLPHVGNSSMKGSCSVSPRSCSPGVRPIVTDGQHKTH